MALPLQQEIGRILMLTLQDFQQRLDSDLQQRGIEGIGQRHRGVFLHLARFGPSRSVDLAAAAGIRPQSMMAIINELEQLGLIRRRPDPQDSRAKLIEFTPQGKELIEELRRSTSEVWGQYQRLLGKQELEHTFGGLKRLLDTVQEPGGNEL